MQKLSSVPPYSIKSITLNNKKPRTAKNRSTGMYGINPKPVKLIYLSTLIPFIPDIPAISEFELQTALHPTAGVPKLVPVVLRAVEKIVDIQEELQLRITYYTEPLRQVQIPDDG